MFIRSLLSSAGKMIDLPPFAGSVKKGKDKYRYHKGLAHVAEDSSLEPNKIH